MSVTLHRLIQQDPFHTVNALLRGVPQTVFQDAAKITQLSRSKLAAILGLNLRTLQRRKTLKAIEAERIVQVARVYQHAARVLGDDEVAKWMDLPNPSLGGKRPIDLLGLTLGVQQVENVLGAIEHGLFL